MMILIDMEYNIISTGSKGNAVVINDVILIDCGVSFRALKDVYKNIKIVLLTHIHSDHLTGEQLKRWRITAQHYGLRWEFTC